MVVIAASSLLCPPLGWCHSHHHLPPFPPSPNTCAFQRLSWQDLLSKHTGLPLGEELALG